MANGRVYPVWAGNLNGGADGARRLDIFTAQVAIAAGPRVVDSTMGPVGEPGDAVNATRAADGTPQASNFLVTFDRPIDPATFGAADVQLVYRNPAGVTTDLTATAGITVTPVPGAGPNNPTAASASRRSTSASRPSPASAPTATRSGPTSSDRIRATVLGLVSPADVHQHQHRAAADPAAVHRRHRHRQRHHDQLPSSSPATPTRSSADLNVSLNLTHTRDGDLTIALRAPDGTLVTLYQKPADAGQNFTGTVFDDAAAQRSPPAPPPTPGRSGPSRR